MMGYEMKTTFWDDFSIADKFGLDAVKDTYKRAFDAWQGDVTFMAELVLVLNWKCCRWYEKGQTKLSKLYSDLYYKCHHWCCQHFKGDDYDYYFSVVD